MKLSQATGLTIFSALLMTACGGGTSSGAGGANAGGGSSSEMVLIEASGGFGLLLPHQAVNPSTNQLVAIRTHQDLIDTVSGANQILPVTHWPLTASLPNGDSGNHYIYAEFKQPLLISSVLDKTPGGVGNSGLLGPIQVLATDPISNTTVPVKGRVFVGGKSYFGIDPNNAPNLELRTLVTQTNGVITAQDLDGNGLKPGLGFPGTQTNGQFPGAQKLLSPNTIVFVADADGDLSTHETFPKNRQIRLIASTAVRANNGNFLKDQVLASTTVGPDNLGPEVAVTAPPNSVPITTPSFGDTNVDPQTKITVAFSEPLQPLSVGSLPTGATPSLSSSIEVKFGPQSQQTKVPFTALPLSVFDLSRWELTMSFAFPGNGPALQQCGTFSTVTVDILTDQLIDLSSQANKNTRPGSTNFKTGEGPGLVNAPVAPDVIYVARTGATPGISVIDLNGFGAGTGNPAFDFTYSTFPKGNSNFPNNPNLIQYGPNLHPPLFPGTCTVDGGSAGVYTLTKDSSLNDLLLRPPVITTVGDMMIGEALDVIFNNGKDTTGCKNGGGNFCAITGKKQISTTFQTNTSLSPTLANQFGNLVPGGANQISWSPHPNPPPLSFPPLCQQPFIGGAEPTSVYSGNPAVGISGSLGLGFTNLLVPVNPLGDPNGGTPPSGLLAEFQNSFFQGPDRASLPNSGACLSYQVRQQVGHFLYVIDRARREIVVLNSNRFTVLDRIPVPDPTDLAMSPNLDFLAVSNQTSGTVSFIDINPRSATFHQVAKTTSVGVKPNGIAWDPGNEDILVCNEGDSTMSIISAFSLEVRNVIKGSLNQPFTVAISQRQSTHGFFRNVYFAWILNRNGKLTMFESGPNGTNGWGFDDTIGVAPFSFQNPKKVMIDPTNLNGAVWVLHENKLNPDGSPSGQPGGAVTLVGIESANSGQIALTGGQASGNPQFRDMSLAVQVSVGPSQLTGIPVDAALDDQNNLGGLSNIFPAVFSAGSPLLINGKSSVKPNAIGTPIPAKNPLLMFLAVPNSSEGPGVVDVISLKAGFNRVDTDPYLNGVQSIPVPGAIRVTDYWAQ